MVVRVSIVVPTYNRSRDLEALLNDIFLQSESSFEVLIVDDGSCELELLQYRELLERFDERFMLLEKASTDSGRGPGAARNRGLKSSRGEFVAFCDDDDRWIRSDHLSFGVDALQRADADMLWADMQTQVGDEILNSSMYGHFECLKKKPLAGVEQTYIVDLKALGKFLKHRIIHCDSLIVRRHLFESAGLYWEHLRFAEDHDFCFRMADKAEKILYRDLTVAALNVSPHVSVARSLDESDRLLFGIMALNHIEVTVLSASLRDAARANRSWKLMELSNLMEASNKKGAVWRLSRESFLLRPSWTGLVNLIKVSVGR